MKLAFFDTKPYDKPGFDEHIAGTDIEIKYFETRLGEDTVQLAKGFDGVCVFVNDTVNEKVINELYDLGVRVVALRCAGFNNVDTKACFGKLHVFRVPAYSPYAVAEHAMALLLTVNRHTNKAYIRTRDFNFSLSGLTGFDLHGKTVGVAFPILSRNRFSLLLRGIAMGAEKVVLLLSYPSDEVGNHLVSLDQLDEAGIDPWHDVLSLSQFRAAFGEVVHPFTGVDYVAYYKSIIEEAGAQAEIVFANRVTAILPYTDTVITCDIHSRQRSKRLLTAAGAKVVLGLDDLLTAPVDGSGYNAQYGLLGSNKADDDRVKLFPRDAKAVAEAIGKAMSDATGKRVEAMVYGDGAFKDPAGKIWELADPVVAPGYTSGLVGTPNELKLKYLADKEFADLSGEELKNAISEKIKAKDAKKSLVGNMVSEGTTPRNLTDLIGSLCDLTSGSGDKGTPIVYIQGYFDNYTNE